MDIDEKKWRSLDLFYALYQAKGSEDIYISDAALVENGIGGRDFWEVVCPLFESEGIIKEYSDPDGPFSSNDLTNEKYKRLFYRLNPELSEFKSARETPATPLTKSEKKELEAEMDGVSADIRKSRHHHFIVDSTKLKAAAKKIAREPLKDDQVERTKLFMGTARGSEDRKTLQSLYLITESLTQKWPIFMVYDEQYATPIRFTEKNRSVGKLYDIAYIVNAPEKRVSYDKRLADDINNGIFKNKLLKDYLQSNGLHKPTLVQKAAGYLALKNELPVKVGFIKDVPQQYRSLYVDKR